MMRFYTFFFLLNLFIYKPLQAKVPDFYRWYNALDSSGITDLKKTAPMRTAMGIAANSPIVDLWQARIFLTVGKFDSSLVFAQKALKSNRTELLFPTYLAISEAYIYQSKYDSANQYCFAMLRLADKAADKDLIAFTYYQLAKLYYYVEVGENREKRQTMYYVRQAIEQKSSWSEVNAMVNQMLGGIYQAQAKYDLAAYHLEQSIAIRKKNHTEYRLPKTYNLLAANYNHKKAYDTALVYFQEALLIATRFGQYPTLGLIYVNIGENCDKQQKYDKALPYYLKALPIFDSTKSYEQMYWVRMHIGQCYKYMKNYEPAFFYYREATKYKEKIFGEKLSFELAKIRVEYDIEKKEHENELLKMQNEVQTTKQKQLQQYYQSLGIAGVFFVLVLIAGFWLFYLWSAWKAKLSYKQKEMSALIEGEQQERLRIAQELHDGLGQLLSAARLNVASLEDAVATEDLPDLNRSLKIIDEACTEVRNISHNMMPSTLIRLGLIPTIMELVHQVNAAKGVQINFKTNVDTSFGQSLDITIYRIVQEILNNMLKHAQATVIEMFIEKNENDLKIIIKDNGVGFDTQNLSNSKGIGWKNIFSRVGMLNGKIKVESELQKGTVVFVDVKIS